MPFAKAGCHLKKAHLIRPSPFLKNSQFFKIPGLNTCIFYILTHLAKWIVHRLFQTLIRQNKTIILPRNTVCMSDLCSC